MVDEWELQEARMGSETVQEDSWEGCGRAKAVVPVHLFLLPSAHRDVEFGRVLRVCQGSQLGPRDTCAWDKRPARHQLRFFDASYASVILTGRPWLRPRLFVVTWHKRERES